MSAAAAGGLNWLSRNIETYLSNAAARRDYRTQLRGNKAMLLWGAYLALLILIGMAFYSSAGGSQTSVATAQSNLRDFYTTIMILLGSAIMIITPALTATTVVSERQRRSLDLVFSAPVEVKYYLVGKMIGAYRYTWMLLILSLPISATCVVLGGATWSDVIAAYIILSAHGLALCAMGLLISSLAAKPVAAVIWTYVAAAGYAIFTGYVAAIGFADAMFSGSFAGASEFPFVASLSPFTAAWVASTYSVILDAHVPNWILVLLTASLFSKLMLLGAGSALSPFGSPESRSLRIHAVAYAALMSFLFGQMAVSVSAPLMSGAWDAGRFLGVYGTWFILAGTLLYPFMACFSLNADRRCLHDGLVSWRGLAKGTPSGGILLMAAVWAVVFAGAWLGGMATTASSPPSPLPVLAAALWSLGYLVLFWGIGRMTSSWSNTLTTARAAVLGFAILIIVLPIPVFTMMDYTGDSPIWRLYVLYPIVEFEPDSVYLQPLYGAIMLVCGVVLAFAAEGNVRRALSRRRGEGWAK